MLLDKNGKIISKSLLAGEPMKVQFGERLSPKLRTTDDIRLRYCFAQIIQKIIRKCLSDSDSKESTSKSCPNCGKIHYVRSPDGSRYICLLCNNDF